MILFSICFLKFPICFPVVISGTSIHNVSEKGNVPKLRNALVYMHY